MRSSRRSMSPSVDALSRSGIDIRMPRAVLIRPASAMASIERPPRSKKSLPLPHLTTPSTLTVHLRVRHEVPGWLAAGSMPSPSPSGKVTAPSRLRALVCPASPPPEPVRAQCQKVPVCGRAGEAAGLEASHRRDHARSPVAAGNRALAIVKRME